MFSRVTFSNGNKSMASSVSGSPAVSPALVSLSGLSVGASQYDTPVSAVPVGGCKVERLLAFIFVYLCSTHIGLASLLSLEIEAGNG